MRTLVLLFVMVACPAMAQAGCFDITKSEPAELSGVLSHRIFAGPPGYEDVDKGDTPEPGYVLKLPTAICLTGDPDFTDPAAMFDEVQLVSREATKKAMQELDGRSVTVKLSGHIPAHTGHHHRPLVAWVDAISAEGESAQDEGMAASVVRAFYQALGAGDGKSASALVVEEKRKKGSFSAKELTRFYGGLTEPLELLDLRQAGDDRYTVRYRYATRSGRCEGAATVRIAERQGRYFVAAIKADNGC